ncbi:MAG: hypothetical protein JXR47_05985 [Thiotrichales bacterium]|nr:hypothetical protein [Thiotrichales bacterium]
MTFVMDHEAGYKGRYEHNSENEEDYYGTCTFTTNEMIGAIKEIFRDLPFIPTLVQGEDDGIPKTPVLCFSLGEVKNAVIELNEENDKVHHQFPNFKDEIVACNSLEEIQEHPVLKEWDYESLIRFFELKTSKRVNF